MFEEKMNISKEDVDDIQFERVHRLPTRTNSPYPAKPRPIIAKFSFYQDKQFVWSSVKNLKNTGIGLKCLHKVQKKIIRLITFSRYQDSTTALFKQLKILDIFQLNTFLTSLFMYSQRADMLPNTFKNYFVQNKQFHQYNTRSSAKLHIRYTRTNYGKFSLKARGAKLWNNLPDEVKDAKSYFSFKRKVKQIYCSDIST